MVLRSRQDSDRKRRESETWRRDRHVAEEAVERRKVNGIEGRCRRYDCVCVRQEAYLIVCWQLFASTSGRAEEREGRERGRREREKAAIPICSLQRYLGPDTLMTDECTQPRWRLSRQLTCPPVLSANRSEIDTIHRFVRWLIYFHVGGKHFSFSVRGDPFFYLFFFFRNRIWWFQILRYLKKIRKKFREHLRTRFFITYKVHKDVSVFYFNSSRISEIIFCQFIYSFE